MKPQPNSIQSRMITEASDPLVLVDGVRTPFSRMGTDLAELSVGELGRTAVTGLLARTGLNPAHIDECIIGCVGQPADEANVARIIALRSGIPESVPAMTVHRNCASGLESLLVAHQRLAAGQGKVFIVGGAESMSGYPMIFRRRAAEKFAALASARTVGKRIGRMAAFRPTDFAPLIALRMGLTDPVIGMSMGETAELLAREFVISREAQDTFAARSHALALAADHTEEIVPVLNGGKAIEADNGARTDSTIDRLGKLRSVFAKGGDKAHGTVTAGNSSQLTDGAVALLAMAESKARQLGFEPIARLDHYAATGCAPKRMGLGPATAIRKTLESARLQLSDIDHLEINEAFAAQVLAVVSQLKTDGVGEVDLDRLNPNGGSIALGHPVGASGARLVLTALRQLERTGGRRAIVSLCVGGGQGVAALLNRTEPKG